MGRVRDEIDESLAEFIAKQHIFFVATAPLSDAGHVNLSPRGHDSLRVLSERRIAWLDLTGSGAETIAHLRENGRITLMWCAFEGPPRIVRIHGRGHVRSVDDAQIAQLLPSLPGARAIIEVEATRISDSCGYAVPLMDFVGERQRLLDWADAKGPAGLEEYRRQKNATSIDGLDAVDGL